MRKIYVLICVISLAVLPEANAQQNPQYTQYMYNMNVVNPAYAGSKESLSATLLFRDQWSGISGAPRTFTFSAHTPIGNNLGVGLSGITDRIGPVEQTDFMADISYTLRLGRDWNLAFGVKAGATFHDIGLADVATQIQDPAFGANYNETYGIFGAGLFLYNNNFYVGLSVPNFLESTHFVTDGETAFGNQERHFFGTVGYVFDLNDFIKFKPSAFVKTQISDFDTDFLSYDFNANFLFYERFEIGASYRVDDAFSALVGVKPFDWMHVGFAYDATQSDLNNPSYEAFITFDIFFKQKTYLSPRYF
jgi:type IX secretion system PorP/SprF family membrane protein